MTVLPISIEMIEKGILQVASLNEAFEQIIVKQKRGDGFQFGLALKEIDLLKQTTNEIGYAPLVELVGQFELLIRQEGMRSRMGLRPIERTAQLLPFFFALCTRLRLLLNSIAGNPALTSSPKESSAPETARKRRVVIVDDSKTFQALLSRICKGHPHLEVVAIAGDATEGEKAIERFHPDVVTLDVHMPGMDGFTFLNQLMKKNPIPVILISSINVESGSEVFDALYQGALDFIPKSSVSLKEEDTFKVSGKIFTASNSSLNCLMRFYAGAPSSLEQTELDLTKVIAIGVASGGARTLVDILRQFPKDIPPVLIAQQIIPGFSKMLIQQLHEVYPFIVKEAEHGELLEPKKIFVAPEGSHMSVCPSDAGYRIRLASADSARRSPSIDILFDSVALCFGPKATGVLLPGSGVDGAQGLLEIRRAGGYTVTQDELDCPDPTLTREAIKIEAARVSAWGDHVAEALLDSLTMGIKAQPKPDVFAGTLFEGEGLRVLIVDDSPTIRALVRYHLRGVGLSNFSEAKNGMLAWQMLVSGLQETTQYSLVISDQNMPQMLGLELLQKIRLHDKLKSLPFILVTTMADKEFVLRAVQGGISNFITKPMSAQVLAEKVRAIFSKVPPHG